MALGYQLAKKAYGRLNTLVFGNRIGLSPNFLHGLYYLINGISVHSQDSHAGEIHASGHTLKQLKNEALVETIASKVAHSFKDKSSINENLKDRGLIRLAHPIQTVPELADLLKEIDIEKTLNSYFGNYTLFRADVYRNLQSHSEYTDSHSWHFDNAPRSLLKIMVYLTDVGKGNGGICLVPKNISTWCKRRGFWDRYNSNRFTPLINNNSIEVLGPKGTCIFFTPQFCLHRAGKPSLGHRDVAVFTIYPSNKTETIDAKEADLNAGYQVNPFTKKPLKRGIGLS